MINNEYSRVSALLNTKNTFSICLPINVTSDSLAAALTLYLMLVKLGKQAIIACAGNLGNTTSLIGADKIKKDLFSGGDDLMIAFPNKQGAVDAVNYGFEDDQFYIRITPEAGGEKLDPAKVKFSYTGGRPEVIFIIDCPNLAQLGELYTANQDKFSGIDIVNIDRHLTNANYGTINIVDKKISSLSELILTIFNSLRLEINKDIATNLYTGIANATNNFTAYNVSATTFEMIAYLLKNEAVRKPILTTQPVAQIIAPMVTAQSPVVSGVTNGSPVPSVEPAIVRPQVVVPPVGQASQPIQTAKPVQVTASVNGSELAAMTPIEQIETSPQTKTPDNPPADWLKPKIFKGGGFV